MRCRPSFLAFVLLAPLCRAADAPAAPTSRPSADGKLPFIQVDVKGKQVRVACEACSENMDVGLEFFCVATGTNEYEAVLRTKAKASHLHLGLLMIGLEPGEPVKYSEALKKWMPPHGPPLNISCQWIDPKTNKAVSVPAYRLMRSIKDKKKELPPFTWIFSGSKVMEDGKYAADTVGYLVSVLNNELTVIDVPQLASRDLESRQLERNTDLLPPTGTEITMVIEAAGKREGGEGPAKAAPDGADTPPPAPGRTDAAPLEAAPPDPGETLVALSADGTLKVDGMTVPIERLKQALADRRIKSKVKLSAAAHSDPTLVGRITRALRISEVPFESADADTAALVEEGAAHAPKPELRVVQIDANNLIQFGGTFVPLADVPQHVQTIVQTSGDKWVVLRVDPHARRDVVYKVRAALEAADIGVEDDRSDQVSGVGIDAARIKALRKKWEEKVAPRNVALREAAQAHYEVIEALRREQQRLVDEADRVQRVIDQLQKEYSDMTTPRPEGQ